MKIISSKIDNIKELINDCDCILIGAGAGLSTAAGIEYTGKRFQENFKEYIEKYHFTDMYTASFYEFNTEEEKWGYWAKHMYMNNIGMKGTKLYKQIYELVKEKEYFVITTNVDEQFYKSGFDSYKIFAVQGSYRMLQCSKACHDKLYDATELVKKMLSQTTNLKVPTELVPKCPVCGEKMEVNLRKDAYFVQDENWYRQAKRYEDFIDSNSNKKVLLLEMGVGFNTPGIIRIPFEQMVQENNNWKLARFNKDYSGTYLDINEKIISFQEDINEVIMKI